MFDGEETEDNVEGCCCAELIRDDCLSIAELGDDVWLKGRRTCDGDDSIHNNGWCSHEKKNVIGILVVLISHADT